MRVLGASLLAMVASLSSPAIAAEIATQEPSAADAIVTPPAGTSLPVSTVMAAADPCSDAALTCRDTAIAVAAMTPLTAGGTRWDLASLAAGRAAPALDLTLPPDAGLIDTDANGDICTQACPSSPIQRLPASEHPGWGDHVPPEYATKRGFFQQAGTVKTEALVFLGYFSVLSGKKLFNDTKPFHFKNEGWFGKDTDAIGMDKMAHAFNTYLLAEFLHQQIHRRSNASAGDAITAAVIASGLMIFNEFSDGIETTSGFSFQDVAMNLAGASFSVLRNTVPGLKDKLAFKIEVVPNEHFYSYSGKPHYEQMRFMFSLKGAGFKPLKETPLRFLDLQVGYYASDFLNEDREAGKEPKRHLFVGVGLNLGELLFGESTSTVGRAAYKVLDYFQVPYTSARIDTKGRFGY